MSPDDYLSDPEGEASEPEDNQEPDSQSEPEDAGEDDDLFDAESSLDEGETDQADSPGQQEYGEEESEEAGQDEAGTTEPEAPEPEESTTHGFGEPRPEEVSAAELEGPERDEIPTTELEATESERIEQIGFGVEQPVEEPEPIAEAPPEPLPAVEDAGPQPQIKELKECPFCGEDILAKALKCKHCGEFLDRRRVAATAQVPGLARVQAQPADQPQAGFGRELASGLIATRSYVGRAFITMFLYWLFYFPGLIANFLWLSAAKRDERISGVPMAGKGCLTFLIWVFFWIPLFLVVVAAVLLAVQGKSILSQIQQLF